MRREGRGCAIIRVILGGDSAELEGGNSRLANARRAVADASSTPSQTDESSSLFGASARAAEGLATAMADAASGVGKAVDDAVEDVSDAAAEAIAEVCIACPTSRPAP